jgi:hypothetical protein
LDILPSKDEFQCLESCQENSNCTWFSFFPDSNFCQTFSSCKNIDETSCPNCISGQRECENPVPICFVQGKKGLSQGIFVSTEQGLPFFQFFLYFSLHSSVFSLSACLSLFQSVNVYVLIFSLLSCFLTCCFFLGKCKGNILQTEENILTKEDCLTACQNFPSCR